ncbi:MAG: hypothetical protein J7L16_01155 [Deltaproteobacteria bacterium]|nr:hypothetical protein [Deltaproteobacteria bacterium]
MDKINKQEPDSERLEALRRIPSEIMKDLTKEEVNAFLYEEFLPDSLQIKLKNCLIDI